MRLLATTRGAESLFYVELEGDDGPLAWETAIMAPQGPDQYDETIDVPCWWLNAGMRDPTDTAAVSLVRECGTLTLRVYVRSAVGSVPSVVAGYQPLFVTGRCCREGGILLIGASLTHCSSCTGCSAPSSLLHDHNVCRRNRRGNDLCHSEARRGS